MILGLGHSVILGGIIMLSIVFAKLQNIKKLFLFAIRGCLECSVNEEQDINDIFQTETK